MDETRLLALIAEGENNGVDFKRELHLDSARDKAELVKDVISIANSRQDIGYLLVGVDDCKYMVGIDALEEERIQQIAQVYIDPPVALRCSLVSTSAPSFPSIGVIEIQAGHRPHRVRRDIDRLKQDDVYVRRGSVVAKATPDEIIEMREPETGLRRESREYVQAAERHLKLGNLEQAYQAYSAAILISPNPELFVVRAKVLEQHRSPGIHSRLELAKLSLALKDYSDALALVARFDLEQKIRLGRLRLCGLWDVEMPGDLAGVLEYVEGAWKDDIRWLDEHTRGPDRGEFLYLKQKARWASSSYYEDGWIREETLPELAEALQLSSRAAEVYYFRALAHYLSHNYGMARQEVDSALEIATDEEISADCLRLRAGVLLSTGNFHEAHETIQRAAGWASQSWLGRKSLHQIRKEIIYRIGIGCEFGTIRKEDIGSDFKHILTVLLLSETRPVTVDFGEGAVFTIRHDFGEVFPEVASTVRSIVGERVWRASMTEDATYSLRISWD